ncbi:MAG TPA: hypothetical protein PK926_01770 [Spirochaetota bacterium]|nr:hypothetical protein [Spirochaetota bacterium]HPI90258.1 hypothetical protein [Spirochaetota bacterium]HPR46501.1 hypothetical protein [Spirochaetota bacterium]
MKKNIISLLMISIFAITVSMGFLGCKKEEAPADQPAVEEPAAEAPAGEAAEEAQK